MRRPPGLRAVAFLLSLVAVILGSLPAGVRAAENVTLILNAPPSGLHAGIIYTQRRGFYTRAGLVVTIERGRGSSRTIRSVVKRQKAFGLGELAAVIESRTEGVDTAGLALLVERFPGSVIALKGSGIRSPADLKGRRLAGPVASFSRILFPYFAERAGLNLDSVRWSDIGAASGIRALLRGEADAVVTSETVRWRYERAAARKKKQIVAFPYAKYGIEVYGLSLVAPVRLIREEEGLVRRMVEATVRGVAEAMARPAEALDLFRRTFPEHPARGAEAEWRVFLGSWSPGGLKRPGLGFFRKDRVARLQALLIRGRQLTREFSPRRFFTNRVVPKVSVRPASF
ncbi:MAG: ABC transporter substrate-binding protein [Nitrospinota bacterium]